LVVIMPVALVLAAGCGGQSGVEKYAAAQWPTFPTAEDPVAVSWPEGKFKSCEGSTRVKGTNYACFYEDDSGRQGFICVTTNFGDGEPYSINVAVGPGDGRQWTNDDGSVMPPKDAC
jgi:hypothetical protein